MSEFLVVYLDSLTRAFSTTSTRRTNCGPRWASGCATTPARSSRARSARRRWPRATFMADPEVGEDAPLTEADRAYLTALELQLDMFRGMRLGE
jgi:hypothetical protein